MAHFNKRVTNRLTMPLARRLPGFGVVIHVGRRSGRRYRTPVNAFRTPRGYAFALTYGPEAEWVKNVLVAGGCELVTRGRLVRLTSPELRHDPGRRAVPVPVLLPLRLLRVADFLELFRDESGSRGEGFECWFCRDLEFRHSASQHCSGGKMPSQEGLFCREREGPAAIAAFLAAAAAGPTFHTSPAGRP